MKNRKRTRGKHNDNEVSDEADDEYKPGKKTMAKEEAGKMKKTPWDLRRTKASNTESSPKKAIQQAKSQPRTPRKTKSKHSDEEEEEGGDDEEIDIEGMEESYASQNSSEKGKDENSKKKEKGQHFQERKRKIQRDKLKT